MRRYYSKIRFVQPLNTEVSKDASRQRIGERKRDGIGRIEPSRYPEFLLLLKKWRHGMRRENEIIALVAITGYDKAIET
jgi:hypothetical protein